MANPQHVSKLAEGVEAWNSWMDVNNKKTKRERPDLSGASIFGAHFEKLRQYSYSNPVFYGAKAYKRRIGMPDLFQVDLSGINLEGVDLQETEFYEPNLTGANLKGASLDGAILCGAKLIGADLTNV